jgi:hypothetical protein
MAKFWDLLERSVIVQAIITLLVIVTICVLVVTGRAIPEIMSTFASLILGYYFGSKVQLALTARGTK